MAEIREGASAAERPRNLRVRGESWGVVGSDGECMWTAMKRIRRGPPLMDSVSNPCSLTLGFRSGLVRVRTPGLEKPRKVRSSSHLGVSHDTQSAGKGR
jgi:hypothetical protein